MNENVIKMARLMGGCKDRTCEDCLSQSKKLFGDNKCALIEYAEVLDKASYRKQSETGDVTAEKHRADVAEEALRNGAVGEDLYCSSDDERERLYLHLIREAEQRLKD